MNTTPLWVPLAVAVFGLLGTVVGAISGVLITQRRSDKREAIAWEREQEREKARWAREDAARTFEYRRDAYISFYKANIEAAQLVSIYIHEMFRGDKDFPYPPIWVPEAEGWREAVQIYGTPTVKTLANKAQEDYRKMAAGVRDWSGDNSDDSIKPLQQQADDWEVSVHELLLAIRKDLGIPTLSA